MEAWSKPQLMELLAESVKRAGNAELITKELIETLAEHSIGNPRVMMNLAAECLSAGMRKESVRLNDSLFFELFPAPSSPNANRKKPSAR